MTTAIALKSGSSLKSTIQLRTQVLSDGRPGLNLGSTKSVSQAIYFLPLRLGQSEMGITSAPVSWGYCDVYTP